MTQNNLRLDCLLPGDVLPILKSLPEDSVDLTITSPPYNKKRKSTGWLVNNPQYADSVDHIPEDQYQDWQVSVLNEIHRVTRPGGSLFYNHKLRWTHGAILHPMSWLTKSKWHLRQEIVWDRGLAANMRGWRFWQVDERVYWLFKPADKLVGEEMLSKHAKLSSIWRLRPVARSEHHPAPFPLELPLRIIYSLFDEDTEKVVLDPFCGIGTTLVAAKLMGHRYIGIDISTSYLESAHSRLIASENERLAMQLEIEKHMIEETFSERKQRGNTTWPLRPRQGQNGTK